MWPVAWQGCKQASSAAVIETFRVFHRCFCVLESTRRGGLGRASTCAARVKTHTNQLDFGSLIPHTFSLGCAVPSDPSHSQKLLQLQRWLSREHLCQRHPSQLSGEEGGGSLRRCGGGVAAPRLLRSVATPYLIPPFTLRESDFQKTKVQ